MRYAICNETFEGWPHERVCRSVAEFGYQGLEIAPFTLAPSIADLSADMRRVLKKQAADQGLSIIGLHWLLAKTEGLHLTSPELSVRKRTAEYLVALARLCRDLGGNIMVFGSPAQRRLLPGVARISATSFALDVFRRASEGIADHGVVVCLEPLSPTETDFLNTCAEAVSLLDELDHPSFRLHLDVKAMSSENRPIPDLIDDYISRTGHFHANDANRRGPGFGAVDFKPIISALNRHRYAGWVSVEVFDYSPDPETIARESLRYMKQCETLGPAD